MSPAFFGRAGEDFTCEWDDVFLRGNKKEVEWVGTWKGKGKKTKSGFYV